MSKIAEYLNKHILGEVTADPTIRARYATDASVLTYTPDIIAYPRVTNDIRKVARFAWQLAMKGHAIPIIARGSGSDKTGGAIGKGIIVATQAHMDRIFEYDSKQKLVRLQPGVTVGALQNALGVHGTAIEKFAYEPSSATVGGTLSRSRHTLQAVQRLEVVLSSGDAIQTHRLSKRELERKKKLDSFEGDIYRELDTILEQNKELIHEKLAFDGSLDHAGYASIAEVKTKEGFDLTPLFLGSQGTLGIISEMIIKADYVNQTPAIIAAAFNKHVDAHDAIDAAEQLSPSGLEYIDGHYFDRAKQLGKEFNFYEEASKEGAVSAVVVASFNDFSERARAHKVKRLTKIFSELGGVVDFAADETVSELHAVHSVTSYSMMHDTAGHATPPVMDGVFVPIDRFEDFTNAVRELATSYHLELPIFGRPMEEIWYTRPELDLSETAGKQKMLRLMHEYRGIVLSHNGIFFGDAGEGRLKTFLADPDDTLADVYKAVKEIFDPHGILNTGAKQQGNTQSLGKHLRPHYTPSRSGELPQF